MAEISVPKYILEVEASFDQNRVGSLHAETESEAEDMRREIKRSAFWLNKHKHLDIRVAPMIKPRADGYEIQYWAHRPGPRGFRAGGSPGR